MRIERIDVFDFKLHFTAEEFGMLKTASDVKHQMVEVFLTSEVELMIDRWDFNKDEKETQDGLEGKG